MLRNNGLKNFVGVLMLVGSLTSCVDDTLDLRKEFDMSVTVGENMIVVPLSSTAEFTLSHMLNINEDGTISALKTDGLYGLSEGDYLLMQSCSSPQCNVEIDKVSLSDLEGSTSSTKLSAITSGTSTPETGTGEIIHHMSITDDNVNPQVLKLKEATTDIQLETHITYESGDYDGVAKLRPGFLLTFDENWTVEPQSDYLEKVSKNVLRVKSGASPSFTKTSPLVLKIKVTKIELNPDATLEKADGLYAVGHFKLVSDASFKGKVGVNSSSMKGDANLTLKTSIKIPSAEITSAVCRVNPEITIESASIETNNIPDVFSDEDNNFDFSNPQFYLTVNNTSPVKVMLNAMITPYDADGKVITDANGQSMAIGVGEAYGTDPIEIPGGVRNYIVCICRTGKAGQSGVSQTITVPTLSNIVLRIPRRVSIAVDAEADSKDYCDISLGHNYVVNSTYKAVIPFSFGENLHFSYEIKSDGWNQDLEDYNFNQVLLSATVVNTIPLRMTPKVYPLDKDGNVLDDIEVEIDGSVSPGTLSRSASSAIKATLTSHAANIKNLDGVKVSFTAGVDPSTAGQPLNSHQSVKFNNIQVTVTGGVTIDLN